MMSSHLVMIHSDGANLYMHFELSIYKYMDLIVMRT